MKKLFRPAAVAGLACAAVVLAAAPNVSPAQAAQQRAAAGAISPFGYNAVVFGVKVVESGTQIRTVKDAELHRPCTRQIGLRGAKPSIVSLPVENDLISLSAISSRTQTYKNSAVYGVKGISTIGDVELGGEFEGVQTPTLVIEGLQSVANAYADTSGRRPKFKEDHDFRFRGISIGNLPAEIPPELQDLLDIIDDTSGQVTDEVLNQIIALLQEVGQVEIPGLGSISLGKATGSTNRNSASAEAYALKIEVTAGDAPTVLQLGRAVARISRPVNAGVFRTNMGALEASILNDTLAFGGVQPRRIPCEGTNGQVRSHTVPEAGIISNVGDVIATLNGIKYSYMGEQDGRRGKGWVRTRVGRVSIPGVDLVIEGITSRVSMNSVRPGTRVERKPTVSVGRILVGGTELEVPDPGELLEFDGGVIRTKVLRDSDFYGVKVVGLQVVLDQLDATIDLASATGKISFR